MKVFEAKFNGKPTEWHMAQDPSGRVWIDRIRYKDGEPNSFGNDVLINCGILTNKPLEYKQQVTGLLKDEAVPFDSTYEDITPLLSHLLPIQEFRKSQNLTAPPNRGPQSP